MAPAVAVRLAAERPLVWGRKGFDRDFKAKNTHGVLPRYGNKLNINAKNFVKRLFSSSSNFGYAMAA